MKAFIAENSKQQLQHFLNSNHHALLISGRQLESLTSTLQEETLQNNKHATCECLKPDSEKNSILIEQVRDLKQQFSLKSMNNELRVMIIENAETMSLPAQNSFLKLLEEPPKGVKFIMQTSHRDALLQTIRSRCALMRMAPVDEQKASRHFREQGIDADTIKRSYALSGGEPGRLMYILQNQTEAAQQVLDQAKRLAAGTSFDRLASVDMLSKDKTKAIAVLQGMDDVFRALSQSKRADDKTLRDYARRRALVYQGVDSLMQNNNTRLVLTDVFINL